MFMNYNDLREACSLIVELVDERNALLEENLYLREQLEQKRKDEMEMYHRNISTTADILNILIEKADKSSNGCL